MDAIAGKAALRNWKSVPVHADLIVEIRAVHTIKGITGFLVYKRFEKFTQAGENLP